MSLARLSLRPLIPALACAGLLYSTAALAQDSASRIARVTVYPGVATGERGAKGPAGPAARLSCGACASRNACSLG